jgi:hypothetical protein
VPLQNPLTLASVWGGGAVGPLPPPSPQPVRRVRINSGKRDILFMPLFLSEIRATSYLRPSWTTSEAVVLVSIRWKPGMGSLSYLRS